MMEANERNRRKPRMQAAPVLMALGFAGWMGAVPAHAQSDSAAPAPVPEATASPTIQAAARAIEAQTDAPGYVLIDPLFLSIQMGQTVPVWLHVETSEDRMVFRYITSFGFNERLCAEEGKCSRVVPAQTIAYSTDPDGRIVVEDIAYGDEAISTIDRRGSDQAVLMPVVEAMVRGATLVADAQTGALAFERAGGAGRVRFARLSLADTLAGLAYAKSFEIPLSPLDYCVMRGFAAIANDPERSPIEEEVLLAGRKLGELDVAQERRDVREALEGRPLIDDPSVRARMMREFMTRAVVDGAVDAITQAAESGKAVPSDKEIAALLLDLADKMGARIEDGAEPLVDIVGAEIDTLRALARHQARVRLAQASGQLEEAVCSDPTLSAFEPR